MSSQNIQDFGKSVKKEIRKDYQNRYGFKRRVFKENFSNFMRILNKET